MSDYPEKNLIDRLCPYILLIGALYIGGHVAVAFWKGWLVWTW